MARRVAAAPERKGIYFAMKKRIISLALAVLMLLAAAPCAFGDSIMSLASVQAGAQIDRDIAQLSPGGSIAETQNVPAGCEVTVDATNRMRLVGAVAAPGKYNFSVTAEDANGMTDVITCSLDVLPALPLINASDNISCYVGATARLTVAAAADGGVLTYQWYLSSSGSNSGGTAIPGATGPEYIADTSRTGVSFYYCTVTNSGAGQAVGASSPVISVSVTEAVVQSIMISTLPTKMSYRLGESFDAAGASILVAYDNGTQQVISEGFSYAPTSFTVPGQATVTLSYSGKSCSIPVTVVSEEDSLQGIGMVILPDKTTYKQGDSFDPTGLVFRAYYSDNSYKDIDSGYTYAPKVFTASGTQDVTITYKEKTCRFSVTVDAVQTVSTLEIASSPGKLIYNVGDSLDTSGLVLKLTNSSGTQLIQSGFICEPSTFTSAGSQAVRVRYGDYVTTFTVTVNSTAASPTPSVTPSATPAPSATVTPAASPSSTPEAGRNNSSRSGNGVLVVIMLVALLCLVALGLYMLVMNAGGWEPFKNQVEYRLYKLKCFFTQNKRR